jgi:hypothetical protein
MIAIIGVPYMALTKTAETAKNGQANYCDTFNYGKGHAFMLVFAPLDAGRMGK